MGKLILYIAASMDGQIAREDGSIDWLGDHEPQPGAESEDYGYLALINRVETVLMGRKTFEQVVGFGEWPYSK